MYRIVLTLMLLITHLCTQGLASDTEDELPDHPDSAFMGLATGLDHLKSSDGAPRATDAEPLFNLVAPPVITAEPGSVMRKTAASWRKENDPTEVPQIVASTPSTREAEEDNDPPDMQDFRTGLSNAITPFGEGAVEASHHVGGGDIGLPDSDLNSPDSLISTVLSLISGVGR